MKNISILILLLILVILSGVMLNILDMKNKQITLLERDILTLNTDNRDLTSSINKISGLYTVEKTLTKWENLKDFDSMTELRKFLDQDKTNELKYIDGLRECVEFSIILQNSAARAGYRMSLQTNIEDRHMINSVIVNTPKPVVVFIEPQTDEFEPVILVR
jgi:hypothetical protein